MASQLEILWFLLVCVLLSNLQHCALGVPQVPCFFAFGDSLSDNGNNNNLLTLAKANYRPYGIDFPSGPSGRFSNGRNMIDTIAELLGFANSIPPFATARHAEILTGVNYASGAAGIRNESGIQQGDRIWMDRQLKNHKITVFRITQMLGNPKSAAEYLSKCIYSVAIGSNDYLNNYFLPQLYPTSRIYTPEQYADVLNQQLFQQLLTLHKFGARKFAVFGLGRVGSTPAVQASCGTNGSACVDNINNAVELFNTRLKSLVVDLNGNISNAKFIFINSSGIALTSPSLASMIADVPCCELLGTGPAAEQCKPNGSTCSNRNNYIFFDGVHPTEVVSTLFGQRAYKAQFPTDAYPFDIMHLAQAPINEMV